jgi:hypothetical protein
VPVGCVRGGKGPEDVVAGYPACHMGIPGNIGIIVVGQELMAFRLQVQAQGDGDQNDADEDDSTQSVSIHVVRLQFQLPLLMLYFFVQWPVAGRTGGMKRNPVPPMVRQSYALTMVPKYGTNIQ